MNAPPFERCARCLLGGPLCICPLVETVETRARFVILRHHKEFFRGSNTARIAQLALPNSELHEYASLERPLDVSVLTRPNTWLLYPDANGPQPTTPAPDYVLVLDGSWSQARKMLQRIPQLRGMPTLSMPAPSVAPRRLRQQPTLEEGMSTMEAMAAAVEVLQGAEDADRLRRLHAVFVQRVLATRGLV